MKSTHRKRKLDTGSGAGGENEKQARAIVLVNDEQVPQTHVGKQTAETKHRIPDDDKVFNSLDKLVLKLTDFGVDNAEVQKLYRKLVVVVSKSEALYFSSILDLVLPDVLATISQPVEGSVDRLIALYGSVNSVCKAAIYISFCLSAKLNNFAGGSTPLFTLKSANYNMTILSRLPSAATLRDIAANSKLKVFDYSDSYQRSNNVSTIYLRGDFGSIHTTLVAIFAEITDTDDHPIAQALVVGNYGNPAIFQRQETNQGILGGLVEEIRLYIYN